MFHRGASIALVFLITACNPQKPTATDAPSLDTQQSFEGFVDLYWSDDTGRLLMRVDDVDGQFLYQSAMARGVGSNDLGLDRGELGQTKVVSFERHGPKVLLVEDNLAYRARSDDPNERRAVAESFARTVVWGFEVASDDDNGVLVDATDFFLRDSHGIAEDLAADEEGTFAVDAARSAIYLPRTKAFPDNTEVEAVVTFVGQATGPHLPTVSPDQNAFSVHLHHSLIRLPDDGYETIAYDPRAGVIGLRYNSAGFQDYATPIGEPLAVDFGRRHRLEKVDPSAELSEAVEPIVYYVDPGAPEPVRQALIDGALWWNQAFEAAGYKDAFQVRLLPDDADPLDVRYNVIQWVHRSTRGWSYGSSVLDPRTGEIIKGHVSLGSLRVRQDYLIVEGLLAPYADGAVPDTMLEVALARIRQLSAHEVGHTIGFEHNFAASTQDRSSVMDYPFPLVRLENGKLDFSDAYDNGIGAWDKRTVLYAYQDFPDDVDADEARAAIMSETITLGYKYVADADSRSVSTAHPDGNLWDNGSDAIDELAHLMRLRAFALGRFSENNIRPGRSLAMLEEALVPVYLLHRFQVQAVGKLIGGQTFNYALRGDGQDSVEPVPAARQRAAIDALLATLEPVVLRLPQRIVNMIPPRPPGQPKTRETFSGHTGGVFDPLAPAASAVSLTLDVLLDPERAARMQRLPGPGFDVVLNRLLELGWTGASSDRALQRQTGSILLDRLTQLSLDTAAAPEVRALALDAIEQLDSWLGRQAPTDPQQRGHYAQARQHIARLREHPASFTEMPTVTVPPGSPIGMTPEW